jgi:hypothetical protein
MSVGEGLLKIFAGPIGILIAGGALATVFSFAGPKGDPKAQEKPDCTEIREPGAKLATYNPDPKCQPK